MDSFFLYRLPGENEFTGGIGTVKTGIDCGFIISSFYNTKEATLTIVKEDDFTLDSLKDFQAGKVLLPTEINNILPIFPFPDQSTLKDEYLSDVRKIIAGLGEKEKTVYCRAICGRESIDLPSTLIALDKAFPGAMVFCFHTPQSGIWFGATPEKLLSNNNGCMTTMALAGTRKANVAEDWDRKNIEEQKMVTDYIAEIFSRHGINHWHDDQPHSKKVGKLEHLCTEFTADFSSLPDSDFLSDFLYDLSPTPALCGFPKQKSFETIRALERFSRAYYGGFMGPLFQNGDFSLYVILRSVRMDIGKWCMYAGGGITASSVPKTEWEETENKAASIMEKLHFFE
ncbi:MAG: chorismate-binding protein [Muribaculaceae bacterium]|nr:chorismate-binding protein [Muribaculaceae bacterium]